jgi:hypothetical protein
MVLTSALDMRIIKNVLIIRFSWIQKRKAHKKYTNNFIGGTMRAQFITANEVAEVMGVSRTKAYQIVRAMNKELKEMGYITIAGKCPVQYFKQKFYGLQMGGDKEP